jgi:hypothetical protein
MSDMKETPYEVRFQISENEVLKLFRDCLCSGSVGFGALRIDFRDEDYAAAKKVLKQQDPERTIYWESVIAEILNLGQVLKFTDVEDDENIFLVNKKSLQENSSKIELQHLNQMLNGNDDAITHDSILQTLILGEIVYG